MGVFTIRPKPIFEMLLQEQLSKSRNKVLVIDLLPVLKKALLCALVIMHIKHK